MSKVFGKWIVYGIVDNKRRMAAHFKTKHDAIEALDRAFKRSGAEEWCDERGQKFIIEKNTVEY